jgi:hypothetical protein
VASAHSSTAGLPDHDGHDARGRTPHARGSSCCSLPGPAASRNPDRPGRQQRHDEHRLESRHRPGQPELPDAHGVVAHENRHWPPDLDRHAHTGRRQPSSTCSERTARNTPVCGRSEYSSWPPSGTQAQTSNHSSFVGLCARFGTKWLPVPEPAMATETVVAASWGYWALRRMMGAAVGSARSAPDTRPDRSATLRPACSGTGCSVLLADDPPWPGTTE